MSPSVLVVDDEPGIREIARAYLQRDGFTVREAGTGALAIDAALTQMPDLIVLDLMLPDIGGEEVCDRIRRVCDIPILMLTAKSAEVDRLRGLSLGADDYLVKPFSPRELVARARAILRRAEKSGLPPVDLVTRDHGRLEIDLAACTATLDTVDLALTAAEFQLLAGMARRPGRVWGRAELLELVGRTDRPRDERTVDVHVRNLRRKLDEATRGGSAYIATARGLGYRFHEPGGHTGA